MMKMFTRNKFWFILFFMACLALPELKAQQFYVEAECAYESAEYSADENTDICLSVYYEEILEDVSQPGVLTIVLNVQMTCDDTPYQHIRFSPQNGSGPLVVRSTEQLAANPIVEVKVDKNMFMATPNIIVTPFYYDDNSIEVPLMYIGLQSKLNTAEPCKEITPMPVELVSFEGTALLSSVALKWRTASEQDNKHFEVERSTDGQRYTSIGMVEGRGNSAVPVNYTFTDGSPLNGVNYYRLKQVDYDGRFAYSKVVAVTYTGAAATGLQATVFPNPCVNGDCTLSISNLEQATETQLRLTDLSGRVVFTKTVTGHSGSLELPLQDLQQYKGLYILSVTSGRQVVHQRILLR